MSKRHYLIDARHGGIVKGEYTTAPKKMFKFDDGFTVYEGVFNRDVATHLVELLKKDCIDHTLVVTENEDIPLKERVERINNIVKDQPNKYVLISIHGNAGGGRGDEIWTSVGETESDRLVEKFSIGYRNVMDGYNRPFRTDTSDGDIDKESNFYILRKTLCPAFLTENGFFDNRQDAEFMVSKEGAMAFAMAHYKGIKKIEDYTSAF